MNEHLLRSERELVSSKIKSLKTLKDRRVIQVELDIVGE